MSLIQNAIVLCYLIYNILSYKNFEKGTYVYALGALIVPTLQIGSMSISYEIAMFPMFLIMVLLRKKIILNRINISRVAYLSLIILTTAYGAIKYNAGIDIVGLFGLFRRLIIAIVLGKVLVDSALREKLLYITFYVNTLIVILQVLSGDFFEMTQGFYSKYENDVLSKMDTSYFRACGTFNTCTLLGALALVFFAIALYKIIFRRTGHSSFKEKGDVVLAIFIGVLSCSKLAYMGFVVVFIVEWIWCLIKGNYSRKKLVGMLCASCIVVLGLIILVSNVTFISWIENTFHIPFSYYIQYFSDPMKIFSTRYGSSASSLFDLTFEYIKNNIICGIGYADIAGVFVGDSAIYTILVLGGSIGICIWIGIYVMYFNKAKKNELLMIVLVCTLIIAMGTNVESVVISILVFGIMDGLIEESNSYKVAQGE